MVLMAAGELTGAVIWVSSTGLEMMNDQLALTYAPLTIFMGLVGYGLVMTPAMIGMGKVVHRFFPDAKKGRRGRRASGAASPEWMRRLTLFPLMQVPLIFIVLGICFSVTRGETAFVVASTAILLLCAAIDALLFLQMRRSAERQRAEIKAALLEERLAGYLRELTAVQELLGDTARLRHDLRNHQAVVATLCERGDHGAALDYLEGAVVALRPVRMDAAGVFPDAIDGVPTGTRACAQETEGGQSWKR